MSFLENIFSGAWVDAVGWTLVHSIWQGALVAILVAVIMILLRKGAARTRYMVYFSSLLLMLGLSTITFFKVYEPGAATDNYVKASAGGPGALYLFDAEQVSPDEGRFQEARKAFSAYFERNFPLFVSLWFLGISFFLLKFLGGYAYTQRLKHYRTLEVKEYWRRKVLILSHKIGVTRSVRLVESAIVKVPMVIGFFKPVILVPLGLLSNLPPQQIEAIIIHELAHIYRKDYLLNLLQSLIDILFFYHPAIWWISRNIRIERENICDDLVIAMSNDSVEYAKALAGVQELRTNFPVPAPALSRNKYHLLNRIQRMMNKPRIKPSFAEGFMSALIILVGIIGMSATAAISFGSEELPTFVNEPVKVQDYAETSSAGLLIREDEAVIRIAVEREPAIEPLPMIIPDTITQAKRDSLEFIIQEEMTRAMEELEGAMEAREKALEAYREAMKMQALAKDEIREQIKESYMENLRKHMEQMRQYLDQLQESMPGDTLNWYPFIPGVILPFHFDRNFDFDHDYDFDYDFDFEEGWEPGVFIYRGHPGWVPAPELLEELEELEELHELQELEGLEELKELEGLEKLKELDELDALRYIHVNPVPKNYEYHYTYPEKFVYHHYSDRTSNIIIKELRRDGLIGWEGDQVIEIDTSGLYINGEKQSRDNFKKYKRLYESLENEKITADNSYKLIL